MKILLINDFKIGGGAEVIFLKTYHALIKIGHDVDIVFGHEKIVPPTSVIDYIFSFKKYHEIKNTIHEKKYDIIYLLNYSNTFSPSVLLAIKQYKKKNPKLQVIYNAHDAHIVCPNSALNYYKNNEVHRFTLPLSPCNFVFKRLDHRGAIFSTIKKIQWLLAYKILRLQKTFDKVLCPSEFLATQISKTYPYINTGILRNPLNKQNIIKPHDYHKSLHKPIKLIFFGRLSAEKGLDTLLKNIRDVKVPYIFHIYGEGPDKEALELLTKDLNLANVITFKGKLPWESLMKIIHQYDAFILPSSCYENAPLSIVEAAYAGLFILTMNYGGMKELAEIVGNSFFIDPVSPKKINAALMDIQKASFENPKCEVFSEESFNIQLLNCISSLK